ncbi:FG-GAP-like repeat-containing protein [Rhizobacter sp. OV335]|uniref:FG-GAP-like repeat-containing protein n=1 Tax=Rhizobacter sp. OV335 TaxID=1500264 RepID=UPI0021006A76|nr:FG-GAP-like repeat-containing protein [Rhizobacter sp. OV335]
MVVSSVALSASAQGLVVSESGQAVYSYPIVVPPGVAGMEPKLSLVYNSGGNNGPIGVGWTVQGISQITRCPKIEPVAVNGAVKPQITPVRYTVDDNLCLDGQRLIKVDTSQGWVGKAAASQATPALGLASGFVEFRTENDGYSRIRASGMAGSGADKGPATFTVQTKAGLTQVYGLTSIRGVPAPDAIALSEGGQLPGVATAWMLKKVVDSVGNAIEFEYDNTTRTWGSKGPGGMVLPGREWNLKRVYYGCKDAEESACPQRHQVLFVYEERPDKAEAYHLGSKVVSTQLLSQVQVSTSAGTVRLYQIGHAASKATNRQLLTTITECAGGTAVTCLPATRFTYPGAFHDVNYLGFSRFNLGGVPLIMFDGTRGTISGDFNGDGKTDLLLWTKNAGVNGEVNELWLADAKVPGYYNKVPSLGDLATVRLGGKFAGGGDDDVVDTVAVDINGDGRQDLLRLCRSLSTTWCPSGTKAQMWLSISDNSPAAASYGQFVAAPNAAMAMQNGVLAPIEGPLVARSETKTTRVCSFTEEHQTFNVNIFTSRAEDAYWQDFDGDGRLDLVSLESVGVVVGDMSLCPHSLPVPPSAHLLRYYVGKGNGQFELKQSLPLTGVHRSAELKAMSGMSNGEVLDIDGDGKPDLLFTGQRFVQGGDGLFHQVNQSIDPAPAGNPLMTVVDANGDGKSDVILLDPAAWRTVPSPIPPNHSGAPNNVSANPHEARLFINQGGIFVRDDRPLNALKAWGPTSWMESTGDGEGGIGLMTGPRFFAFGGGTAGSMPLDINGDGLTDFMAWTGEDDRHDLRFFTSMAGTDGGKLDGSLAAVSDIDRGRYGLPEMATGGVTFMSGDFMGLGSVGFIRMQDGGNNNLWYRDGPPPDVMTSVMNLSGVTTWISYSSTGMASAGLVVGNNSPVEVGVGVYVNTRPPIDLGGLTDPQARADKAGKHTWPTHHAHPAQWLVGTTKQQSVNGVDPSNLGVTTAFAYVGMKSDLSGGGDLGLESVTKYFPYANGGMMASTTEYLQPLNSETGQEGTQRKQFVGMPKCTYTRYIAAWVPNASLASLVRDDVDNSRNVRPGSPRQLPKALGSGTQSSTSAGTNSECFDVDGDAPDKPADGWGAQIINMTTYVYCDVQSQASASSATWMTPCGTTEAVKRPYQMRSVERTWDPMTPALKVGKVDTVNTAMTAYGDVGAATITTTGYGVGGQGSQPQVMTKSTTNTYLSGDGGTSRFVTEKKWFLGRLGTSTVKSTTNVTQPLDRSDANLSPAAKATQDPALNGTPTKLLRPEVLMTILQLLLED